MRAANLFHGWGKLLAGKVPMLSIEVTRECPLRCPGCYAYGDSHLGEGGPNLRSVTDYRGEELVSRILRLVDEHQPLHVSLVGGEPLIRHRELSLVLPELSRRGIYTMVVTSAVIPIPEQWPRLPRVTIAVSVDGNPEDHDVRRKPATYARILENIRDRKVNIHWTVVRRNIETPAYMDRYLDFWSTRPEVNRIWVSAYTPQIGEQSDERLIEKNRCDLAEYFSSVGTCYPKLTMHPGLMDAFLTPPVNPAACLFSQLSVNYTADLQSRVEPCVFGGEPNCAECGCSISMGLHWMGDIKIAGPLRVRHLVRGSMAAARFVNPGGAGRRNLHWTVDSPQQSDELVQIQR